MSSHDNELENNEVNDKEVEITDSHRQRRRRLLATLGMGIAGAYVAPTLFSVGQAQAWDRRDRRYDSSSGATRHGSYRHSYSRPSYSRPSGYDHRRRERSRLREYRDDPVLILEDVILGPPGR